MGIKNSSQVLDALRKLSPSSFSSRVDSKQGFKTFAVDLMSLLHSTVGYCRTGREILQRLKSMVAQHKKCSKKAILAPGEVEHKKIYTIFALDDYSQTPKNKEIERASRIESDRNDPYTETIQLYSSTGDERDTTLVDANSFEYTSLDACLPIEFSRVRATPFLMRKLLRFLCKIIAENCDELVDNDPNHIIIVDGFRDYTTLTSTDNENIRGSAASQKIGIWLSDSKIVVEKSKIGEGDVKVANWAILHSKFGPVLVHANDGDILALLCMYTCRQQFEKLVIGVMSTSYLFPINDGKSAPSDNETQKIFCPGTLSVNIYNKVNENESLGVIMPQTYFLFMLMCGGDYVESLPGIGPAKLMSIVGTRRAGLLDKAVTFVKTDARVSIEVDEQAILDTIVMKYSSILLKENITPQYLAAWIRRATWALDYNINGPLDNVLLDPCEQKDGLSLHGYQIGANGYCAIDNEVFNPTLVKFDTPSVKLKRKTAPFVGEVLDEHLLESPNRKKARAPKQVLRETKSDILPTSVEQQHKLQQPMHLQQKQNEDKKFVDFHDVLPKFVSPREQHIAQMRNPIPFGKKETN